ncbi:MAG TPA: tyrosine-protein phosphatase [Rhizomicrobium sp.]
MLSGWVLLDTGAANAEPAIPFTAATAETLDGRTFSLNWSAPGVHQVRIEASVVANHFVGPPVATSNHAATVTLILPDAPRWYFELIPDRGAPLVIADRSLHLLSAANFRDVGGYRTKDGRWVRMGLAYRSNALNQLTDADLARASALGIKIVCDLRMDDERRSGPDPVLGHATEISDNVMADRQVAAGRGSVSPARSAVKRMQDAYRDFVSLPSAQRGYHDLFERLSNSENLPTVFHCTAGKDRTGWAQAVLLTILGVPRDVILEDYVLTDHYLEPQIASVENTLRSVAATAKVIMRADPSYLRAAFQEVDRRFGSFDNYLHKGLKLSDVTLTAIRGNFL